MRPITDVAGDLGLDARHVIPHGTSKAKLSLEALKARRTPGHLILVSAITPTPAGEGKTTMAIALAQGLAATGRRACVAVREPSLGPIFGRKGGATGGGRSALVPSDDINLHFTGDFHAITAAHNLLAAVLDNHLHRNNRLRIDLERIFWRRVVDVNDRALRSIVIGLGRGNGVPRASGFDITAASEVMAALCLARDVDDLRARLGRMIVGLSGDGLPVTAAQLQTVGAMLALLKDALLPNLVQTTEGVPALVHGGPFANIAHGASSVIATNIGMAYADWTVTEAGFGFDLGGEKFFDLTAPAGGCHPAAVVLVVTVRALRHHGGVEPTRLDSPDRGAVERGVANLVKQVENVHAFGPGPVVALNRFTSDTEDEIAVVRAACQRLRAPFAVCDGYAAGGEGAVELAERVASQVGPGSGSYAPLYDADLPAEGKLAAIAETLYGAASVSWTAAARRDLDVAHTCRCAQLPLCVAKTPASLSDDPTRVGRPERFSVTVRRVLIAAGAGYLVPVLGRIQRMPGLPSKPQAETIDLRGDAIIGVSS